MDSPADGTHMIVLPDGGYAAHAAHEAEPVASWLGDMGVQASPHGLGLAQDAGETASWTTLARAWIHEQAALPG
jgi:hypothetical protein